MDCRKYLPTSCGTFVAIPHISDDDWIFRIFSFCQIRDPAHFAITKNYHINEIANIWTHEEPIFRVFRRLNSEVTGTPLQYINSASDLTISLMDSSWNVTLAEIYLLSKFGNWNVYIWKGNHCMYSFKFGGEQDKIIHFMWQSESWCVYIPQSLMSQHMTLKRDIIKSMKRKRQQGDLISLKIQDTNFLYGSGTSLLKGSFNKVLNSPLDATFDGHVTSTIIDHVHSFMQQFDMTPYVNEFDIEIGALPHLYRGLIPYAPTNAHDASLNFAFCHIFKKSPYRNHLFLVENLPDVETENWCRDYFMKEVYGDCRSMYNTKPQPNLVVDQNLVDIVCKMVNDATEMLCSNSTLHDWPHARARFLKASKNGPTTPCELCDQLYFKDMMHNLTPAIWTNFIGIAKRLGAPFATINDDCFVCDICLPSVNKRQLPKFCRENGMSFPPIPRELQDLSKLEERLISPRIPLMVLRDLKYGNNGPKSLVGPIVYVPCNVLDTIQSLPRSAHESMTLPLLFKRRKKDKNNVYESAIRPQKIREALKWLYENSELWRRTTFDEEKLKGLSEVERMDDFINKILETTIPITESDDTLGTSRADQEKENENDTDEGIEDDDNDINDGDNGGNLDTLVMRHEVPDMNEKMVLAPGEGRHPESIFFQQDESEVLSFPTIFAGHVKDPLKTRKVKIIKADDRRWQLRSRDRRVARNIPILFFKYFKMQKEQLKNIMHVKLRVKKQSKKKLTAGVIRDFVELNDLAKDDIVFPEFKILRGSPQYWSHAKKDLFATLRQLGKPTFFLSFSMADMKWEDLKIILNEVVNNIKLSPQDASKLTKSEIYKLIRSDPITCARHFSRGSKFSQEPFYNNAKM